MKLTNLTFISVKFTNDYQLQAIDSLPILLLPKYFKLEHQTAHRPLKQKHKSQTDSPLQRSTQINFESFALNWLESIEKLYAK